MSRSIAPEIEAGTRLVFAEAEVELDAVQATVLRVGTVGRMRFEGAR